MPLGLVMKLVARVPQPTKEEGLVQYSATDQPQANGRLERHPGDQQGEAEERGHNNGDAEEDVQGCPTEAEDQQQIKAAQNGMLRTTQWILRVDGRMLTSQHDRITRGGSCTRCPE